MTSLLTIRDDIKSIKMELAELYYSDGCAVCGKTKSKKGMVYHHKKYILNDVVHSNYPNNSSGTLQYYKDLAPLIRQNPKRFLYLCSPHHQALERLLRYGTETFKNLIKAVKMSK